MTINTFVRSALAVAVLISVAACDGSPAPEKSAGVTSGAETRPAQAGEASPAADATPVTAGMPDLVGGNAGSASEQLDGRLDMVFEDASGQGRPVDDPAEWRICGSRPGPHQQITGYPVVFEVVRVAEDCA
ncbi:hypothetical protein ACIF9R_14820 [Streptomyces sp. NPDC086080]|uniref:hypothetical protein n=1 Tax=Streptomyces sp. NPDC086080 TaxID=3365748 RepID=UPI0037D64A6E